MRSMRYFLIPVLLLMMMQIVSKVALRAWVVDACSTCLFPAPHRSYHWPAVLTEAHRYPVMSRGFAFSLVKQFGESKPSMLLGLVALKCLQNRVKLSETMKTTKEEDSEESGDAIIEGGDEENNDTVSSAMVASIGFYKNFISPLLPPACRFLPTCSQYGVQAIEEFGPTKGAILTAWRLARCSPFGGKGYDPPRWPPVRYNYGSY